ncbi:MAG: hypothetical protein R3E77_04570 [Steroidobacteraceae bacterium]
MAGLDRALLSWVLAATISLPVSGATPRYVIRAEADLSSLAIELRSDEPFSRLVLEDERGWRYLGNAADCEQPQNMLQQHAGIATLPAASRCLRYRFAIRAEETSATRGRRRSFSLPENLRQLAPDDFLLRIAGSSGRAQVRIVLPEGMQVSVPWRPVDGSDQFLIEPSAQSSRAIMLLGRFEQRDLRIGDTTLRVAIAAQANAARWSTYRPWLAGAAAPVVAAGHGLGGNDLQVVIVPIDIDGAGAVPFGHVIRNGGESLRFFVNGAATLAQLRGDWTASHEFSHLLLPHLSSGARWISEGFASYYQNIFMFRSGGYDEATAWRKLLEGFNRARPLKDMPIAAASAGRRGGRMLVYWLGAAFALQADVALRRRSDGRESLDSVLAQLRECCLPAANSWSGEQLTSRLDELSKTQIFSRLYRSYLRDSDISQVDPVLDELGVSIASGRTLLDAGAVLAPLRTAILQGSQ